LNAEPAKTRKNIEIGAGASGPKWIDARRARRIPFSADNPHVLHFDLLQAQPSTAAQTYTWQSVLLHHMETDGERGSQRASG
jgi:hypothetical protein